MSDLTVSSASPLQAHCNGFTSFSVGLSCGVTSVCSFVSVYLCEPMCSQPCIREKGRSWRKGKYRSL